MAPKLMAYQLHIKQEMIRQILREDFAKRKICAKFVPQNLSQTSNWSAEAQRVITAWWRLAAQNIYLSSRQPIFYTA
jgi:hypothetical protein